jgi:FkbM family methyltransferase
MSVWTARARRIAMAVAPSGDRLPVEYRIQERMGKLDAVLDRLDLRRRMRGRAIDAGANTGAYTYAFWRIFDAVESFEPQPECVAGLAAFARRRETVRVHRFGLSDCARRAELHVPIARGRWRTHLATGLASLQPHATLPTRRIAIDLVPLDAFAFDDVAAIKIDVEGHEKHVLAGARATIARCKPTLIVEIEARHLPNGVSVDAVFGMVVEMGYRGWFFRKGELTPLEKFDLERDQVAPAGAIERGERAPEYVNNFVFMPASASRVELFSRGALA